MSTVVNERDGLSMILLYDMDTVLITQRNRDAMKVKRDVSLNLKYVTIKQIAEEFSCSERQIWRMISEGTFPQADLAVGRMRRWKAETVKNWSNEIHKVKLPPKHKDFTKNQEIIIMPKYRVRAKTETYNISQADTITLHIRLSEQILEELKSLIYNGTVEFTEDNSIPSNTIAIEDFDSCDHLAILKLIQKSCVNHQL